MIISRTPLRISFFGGGTDYPAYFQGGKQGLVLGTSINQYTYITVSRLTPFFEHSVRVTYSKAELVNSIDELDHPSVRECLRFLGIRSNIEIHHIADLPARTGLGSSSAFTVGLLHAAYAYLGRMVRKERLAKEAIHVEQDLIGERVGCQDQYLTCIGGLNLITFEKGRTPLLEPVCLTADRAEAFENSLMLFYTRVTRHANEVVKEQLERTSRRANDDALEETVKLTRKALQVLTSDVSLEKFGKLIHEAWLLKKSLASNITTALVDDAYAEARRRGAWGGKLAGAGGGGFLLLCVPGDARESIRKALTAKGLTEVKFRFDYDGSRIIYFRPDQEGRDRGPVAEPPRRRSKR